MSETVKRFKAKMKVCRNCVDGIIPYHMTVDKYESGEYSLGYCHVCGRANELIEVIEVLTLPAKSAGDF